MKDADYKHRPLIAMSTTGKLTPPPPRPPEAEQNLAAKTGAVPRPRISPHQPAEPAVAKTSSLKDFFRGLVKKKP